MPKHVGYCVKIDAVLKCGARISMMSDKQSEEEATNLKTAIMCEFEYPKVEHSGVVVMKTKSVRLSEVSHMAVSVVEVVRVSWFC